MGKLKTLLRRLKYKAKYLIKANNEIPVNFRIFERRNTNFINTFPELEEFYYKCKSLC